MRPHRRQPTRLPHPWVSPDKNTGVGCHFLLQCMKVKSESEAAQSCPTLSDPMDCSLPGSSVHGIFQARVLEWGAIAFFDKCVYPEAILNLKNCFTPNCSFDFLFWNSDRITRSCRRKKNAGKVSCTPCPASSRGKIYGTASGLPVVQTQLPLWVILVGTLRFPMAHRAA